MEKPLVSSPSLEEIFAKLSLWPQDRLHELQRKLKQGTFTNGSKLLEAMVLKSLGKKEAALEMLNGHPNIKGAQYVANAIQSDNIQCVNSLAVSKQDSDLRKTLAQVYNLLQNESMSGVFGKNSTQKFPGRAEESNEPHTLKSRIDSFPTPASPTVVSSAILIDRVNPHPASVPDSLHSVCNITSLTSELAISQSPTAFFIDAGNLPHSPRTVSKLCNDITTCSLPQTLDDRNRFVNQAVKGPETHGISSTSTVKKTLTHAPSRDHFPVECTDNLDNGQLVVGVSIKGTGYNHTENETTTALPTCETVLRKACLNSQPVEDASHLTETKVIERVPQTPSFPVGATTPAKESEVQDPTTPPTIILPLPEQESSENSFYSFVILHVKEDESIASKVRDTLESLGIANGTTFCDGFERPGCSNLSCLKDAIDNSAFTILLLTPRWNSRWTNFQTDTALMNAIEHKHKYNTVIPYLPRGQQNIPWPLKSLTALDENSSTFCRTAQRTFTLKSIKKQKAIWQKEENIKALERKTGDLEIESDQANRMQENYIKFMAAQQKYLLNQPMFPVWSSAPGGATGASASFPPFLPGMFPFQNIPCASSTAPQAIPPIYQCHHPVNNIPSQFIPSGAYCIGNPFYQQPPTAQQGTQYASGGQHPVIQIQHASNVQIGDQNQMRINRAEEEVESAELEDEDVRL